MREKEDKLVETIIEILASCLTDNDVRPRTNEIFSAFREAGYMTRVELAQDVSGYFSGRFEKIVCGLIQDTINQHGEINDKTKSSLAKRIARQILQVIRQS